MKVRFPRTTKLTLQDKLDIVKYLSQGNLGIEIAIQYGIHSSTVSRIKNRYN